MADFKINRIRFTWKGDWVATTISLPTVYVKDDIVRYGGKSYVCLVGHGASVDFNTDLNFVNVSAEPDVPAPKWGLWLDGYEWKGAWTPTTFYDLGDYVQYGSIVYICNNSHTSSTLVLGLENDQNKWTRYAVTERWIKDWLVNTRYKLNDVVRYGGTLYRCNLGHTSSLTLALGLEADILKWDVLTYANDWKQDWLVNTRYKLGDVVRYGGIVYKCTLGHTSALTALLGIDPNIGSWTIVHSGIDYKVSWVTNGIGYRYKLNDIVQYGADLYICTTAHPATATFDTAKFTIWLPGLEFVNQWSDQILYVKGDVVTYGGYQYTSNSTNNLANLPPTSIAEWTLLVKNYNIHGDWEVAHEYKTGDVVRRSGYLYVAITDSVGVETTDTGKWELINPGVQWRAGWLGGATATVVSGQGDGEYATINFINRNGAPFIVGSVVTLINIPVSGYNAESATIVRCTNTSITYANTTNVVFTVDPAALATVRTVGRTYTIGDLVTFYSATYICKLKHTAIPAITPLYDTTKILTQITGVVGTGTVATLSFTEQPTRPYYSGQTITVENINPSGYNGTFTVSSATPTSVSYELLGFSNPYVSGGVVLNESSYWTLYTKGDQYQTLQYQGDLQTYNQGQWQATTLGQQGNLLKSQGTLLPIPAWDNYGPIGGVYYVAGSGTDAPGFGSTLNNPFRTIRYACSVVVGPATIFIKTGYFSETLPIVVPAGVALCGDELRGTTVQPNDAVTTTALATFADTNLITVASTVGLADKTPIRFTNASVSSICTGTSAEGGSGIIIISTAGMSVGDPIVFTGASFGGIVSGTTYYILNIASSNTITITAIKNSGVLFVVTTDTGTMTVTAGNFGGLSADRLYYVLGNTITSTKFKVSTTLGGNAVALTTSGGIIGSGTTFSTLTGTSIAGAGIYNTTTIGGTISSGIVSLAVSGVGSGALFAITKTGTGTTYTNSNTTITVIEGGVGYAIGDVISISGSSLGGQFPTNTLTFTLTGSIQNRSISIIAGNPLQDMFYVRNGSGIRNMTLRGLSSILGPNNAYGTRRPLAGAYVSLDPGTGPTDTSAWISSKSPYIQNVTTFGEACTGCKIDGSLHNGGNRSIVSNDFTQVLSGGIGVWCTNSGALTELVSVFSYYGHIGYLAENGGKIRSTNGNTSYGDYGAVAEGFDLTETALTAVVNNRNQQAQVAQAFSGEATNKIVKLEFSNAGQNYTSGSFGFTGSGTGAIALMDEFRDGGIYEARITGADSLAGGSGYITASNQAQAGDTLSITIASNDQGTQEVYATTRLLITSGTGVGQYGYIQNLNEVSKLINICKESFTPLVATATEVTNNLITVASTSTLYVGMPVVFSPSIQITNVSRTTNATAIMGSSTIGATGILTVGTVSGTITVGMLLSGGTIANGVYITARISFSPIPSASPTRVSGGQAPSPTFVVSSSAGISVGHLVTGLGVPENTYVFSIVSTTVTLTNNFQLNALGTYNFFPAGTGSTWQTSTTIPQTSVVITGTENTVTVGSTAGMWVTKPIIFTGTIIVGGLIGNTTYYILGIIGNKLAVSTSLSYPTVTLLNSTVGSNATMIATSSGTLGGVSSTAPYYVISANFSSTKFAVSTSLGGSAFTLTNLPAGTMTVNALGWDNMLQGLPAQPLLDSTSVYSIEPRVTFSTPPYNTFSSDSITSSQWCSVTWGAGLFLAISSTGVVSISTNGQVWQTQPSLPSPASAWTDVVYGQSAGRWVAVMSGSACTAAYSTDGLNWFSSVTTLGTGTWSVCFGNNIFVAVCSASRVSAQSAEGISWTLTATALPTAVLWSSIAYGSIGIYVAIASGGTAAASSPDGITWTPRTLPGASATWTSVTWGNGRFVAIASGSARTAYSLDGITWYSSTLPTATTWTAVGYGQGLFMAVASGTSASATSPDGLTWTPRLLADTSTWSAIAFGNPTNVPSFCAVSAGTKTNVIRAGTQALGRAVVSSSRISLIKIWEPGSNYSAATATITDPNATLAVEIAPRIGTGVLGNPTFKDQGTGYRSSTTITTVSGTGFADIYQNAKLLSVSGLASLPTPGAALTIGPTSQTIYRIVVITDLSAGKALFQVSPPLNNLNAPEHLTTLSIRQKYSQCRITGHDFLLIGTGNATATNYPNVDITTASSFKQMNENGGGRVFQTSTDQDGNFKVGDLFAVEQASGIVTISADQFSLTGLDELTLGGFALGTNSVVVTQFSTDSFFTANSDAIVPTQKAIKSYLSRNIAGGGSNAQTGQITSGTVGVGGPNKIFSSINSQIIVTNQVKINGGPVSGINGTMLAHQLFAAGFNNGPNET